MTSFRISVTNPLVKDTVYPYITVLTRTICPSSHSAPSCLERFYIGLVKSYTPSPPHNGKGDKVILYCFTTANIALLY